MTDNSKSASYNADPKIRNNGYVTMLLSLLSALSRRWEKSRIRGP